MTDLLALVGAIVALSAVLTAYGLRPDVWHARPARGAQAADTREDEPRDGSTLGADLTASSPSQVRTDGRTLARLTAARSAWREAMRAAVDRRALAPTERRPRRGRAHADRRTGPSWADRSPYLPGPDYRDPRAGLGIDTRSGHPFRYSGRSRVSRLDPRGESENRRPSPIPANREYP